MDELTPVYANILVVAAYFAAKVATRRFDPFEPVWLFLVGYVHLYIVQPLSYHDWAVGARGVDLVFAANLRSLWALLWFFAVYHSGIGGAVARLAPRPPRGWSRSLAAGIAPPLVLWGLVCAGVLLRGADETQTISAEESLFRAFPFVMLVAGILLIVTGRSATAPSPFTTAGVAVSVAYILIWMFNGKRSHSLVGLLATVCAWYVSRSRRPSWPVLLATGLAGVLAVGVAIGWRGDKDHDRSVAGFLGFIGDFGAGDVWAATNLAGSHEDDGKPVTYESEEYGGFLLMMDTVPAKSGYDGGANYLRVFTTFIPRIVWPTKPVFGRAAWLSAWIEGSELKRDENFTGPAIGLLGATQLNGGAAATLIVLACLAIVLRASFVYFRANEENTWVRFWWSITYYNAWFTVVNDDPLIWFYYNWGFTTLPVVVLAWWGAKADGAVAARSTALDSPIAAAS